MGNFNDRSGGNRGGSKPYRKPFGAGGGGFGGGAGGGRGGFGGPRRDDGGVRELHTATCSDCGNECQVPFRPNGSKPVFCNNCFKRDEAPRFDAPQRSFPKPEFERRAPAPAAAAPNMDQFKIQLDVIHNKLDRILKLVSPSMKIEEVVESTTSKAPAKSAPKAEKADVASEAEVAPKAKAKPAAKKKAAK